MNIQDSPIYKEILRIFGDGAKPINYMWSCQIHANGQVIDPYVVRDITIKRNYHEGYYSDEMLIEVDMRPGDYDFLLWPYKDALEITLKRTPLAESTGSQTLDQAVQTQRYRAIPLQMASGLIQQDNIASGNKNTADNLTIKTAQFQLIDLVIERIRMMSMGCVIRNSTPADAIGGLLKLYSDQTNVDKDISVQGVDIAPGSNAQSRTHIVLPHGTKVVDMPLYIHKYCGGVFATGFCTFLQNRIWYVFPPYDLQRYHNTTKAKTLTVVNLPKNRLPSVERSYRVTDTQVVILANGETKHVDNSEFKAANDGNGVRFTLADNVMNSFITVDNNRAITSRNNNNVEAIFEQRPTGLNQVTISNARITSNIPYEKSKLAYRAGAFVAVSWEQALQEVIYPGMPLKYIYEQSGQINELYGCVVGAQYFVTKLNKNMLGERFQCNSALMLFIEKADPLNTTATAAEVTNQ